jgi:Bacterial Ig-like domain (group 2)
MNLAVPRRAVVMRVPPQWALNNLISLFSLLLLVGCCQFFRGPDEVVSFTISPLNMSIQPGTTQNFSATGTFGLGETKDITSLVKWASSNPARVTIDSAGLATAIANGTVTISGTYECYTTGTSLSVVNQTAAIRSIAITPQTAKVTGDLHTAFFATATYSDSTNHVITNSARWTSSNDTIATASALGLE